MNASLIIMSIIMAIVAIIMLILTIHDRRNDE